VKKIYYFIIALLFFYFSSLSAQTTQGKEFWITFGDNVATLSSDPMLELQIRIVSSDAFTTGSIYFKDLNQSVPFSIGAHSIFSYNLNPSQKQAVYNTITGIVSNKSIHIISDKQVSVYA